MEYVLLIKNSKAIARRDSVIANALLMTPTGINLAEDLRFGHMIAALFLCYQTHNIAQ